MRPCSLLQGTTHSLRQESAVKEEKTKHGSDCFRLSGCMQQLQVGRGKRGWRIQRHTEALRTALWSSRAGCLALPCSRPALHAGGIWGPTPQRMERAWLVRECRCAAPAESTSFADPCFDGRGGSTPFNHLGLCRQEDVVIAIRVLCAAYARVSSGQPAMHERIAMPIGERGCSDTELPCKNQHSVLAAQGGQQGALCTPQTGWRLSRDRGAPD